MDYSTAQLKELREKFKACSQVEAEAAVAIDKVIQIRETGELPAETGNGFTKDGRPNRLTPEGRVRVRAARYRRAEREREAKLNGELKEVGKQLFPVKREHGPDGKFLPKKKGPHSVKKAA